MRRKGMAAMRVFSVFMAIVTVILSVPQTALASEVKVIESPQTMAETSEETSPVKEETEENQKPEETPEENSGEISERKEDSENEESTDNNPEDDAETVELPDEESDETPDCEEDPDADTETDADEESGTDQEIEKEIEEPTDAAGNLINQLTIKIPGSVLSIEEHAFYNQGSITHFLIGENSQLTTIGIEAFYNCPNLTYIELPDSITSIGRKDFWGDVKLGSRDKEGNPVESPELKFSVQLLSLGEKAFSSCASLQKIEFEVNNYYTHKQELGEGVFENCTSLKTIKFGNKIQAIPNKAFSGCTALEELEIPYGVTSIGTNAFYNCHELKYLFIPSSVTTIKTTQSELAFCYEQGLKIYVEKGESAALTRVNKIGFETEVGIYRTREEFPDEAFFMEMNTQRFDKNFDTRLTLRELEQINTLELSKLVIADMTGIQILTYVESLNCSENRITALDTSALTRLKTLNCANNKI